MRASLMTLAFILVVSTLGASMSSSRAPKPERENCRELIFFAVLEGLYRDGVTTEDVDIILQRAKNDKVEGYVNFIDGCPLCIPALNAFRLYRVRPEFEGWKGSPNTFGSGLAKSEREGLRNSVARVRLDALRTIIDRWVGRRLASKRLTSAERNRYESDLAARREKAMAILEQQRKAGTTVFGGTDFCAICDGAYRGSTD